jgi:hypothetical protein
VTKHEGMRARMQAAGQDANDVTSGMTEERRALLADRLDGLPDVTVTINATVYDDRAVIEEALDVPRQSPN